MKIIQVIVGLNVGGAELMLRRLISGDRTRDHRHIVVSLTETGVVGEELKSSGIVVHSLGMRSVMDIPRIITRLAGLIRSEQPDIVQTWMYHADLMGGIAARLAGNHNVIWGIRTTALGAGGKRSTMAVRKVCAMLSRCIPRAIVCAAEASRVAHIELGYDASRMMVIPNGFDFARLSATPAERIEIRSSCGFADGDIVIGSVGRFHRAKDHRNFVAAAGIVANRHSNVRFLMVGRDLDASNRELASWIDETGHRDRFVLLGERKDVPVCLSGMDLFCLSSRTEGFPNVVGEAMAMGLPCVATDVGDAAMLVGGAGIVVPKEDSVQLADGMLRCLRMSPLDRVAMGNRGRERVFAEFSIDRARERFDSLYRRLVDLSGKGIEPAAEDGNC